MEHNISPEVLKRIQKLEKKFAKEGQDLYNYLDGLYHADYLTYWDYIHLDILLNMQNPRTTFPDEKIFIMYHQITELYFKLIIHAIEQIVDEAKLNAKKFIVQLRRINDYFENLVRSFSIMIKGMDKKAVFRISHEFGSGQRFSVLSIPDD